METEGPPIGLLLIGLAWTGFIIFCAVKTAMNGRWGLFILGWFCSIAWIIGAFSGPAVQGAGSTMGMSARQYRKYRAKGRTQPRIVNPAPRVQGRCPACGKPNQTGTRCTVCGTFFGG